MSKPVKYIVKYSLTLIPGIALAVIYMNSNGVWNISEKAAKYRIICDAFTIPAILLLCIGALVWLSGEGALMSLSWMTQNLINSLIPGRRGKIEKYGDYVVRKRSMRKTKGYGFIFVSGLLLLIVAIVFMILFYKAY